MILVDTSVWVDHFGVEDETHSRLLRAREVLIHPFVIGELALGHVRRREAVFRSLLDLPASLVADDAEVLRLIERAGLIGAGIGYVDAHLLASVRMTPGARLWTRDRRLCLAAERLLVAADLPGRH